MRALRMHIPPGRRTGWSAMALACALGWFASGCTDMYNDARIKPLQASKFYADGQSSRPLVEGTVPRGSARTDELFTTGKINGSFSDAFPVVVTDSILGRGEERFNIFCSPCHGRLGDGLGMIVQRGFPRPRSFHEESVRAKPAGYYFDVISNGFGRMFSYAPSIPVEDRWAVVSYLRALQLSRKVEFRDLTAAERDSVAR